MSDAKDPVTHPQDGKQRATFAAMRESFTRERDAIYSAFLRDSDPYAFFRSAAGATDALIAALWPLLLPRLKKAGACLMAVGGFGRREFYPHSDVDLALIVRAPLNSEQNNELSHFLSTLWDWGLSPSLTAGTVEELFEAAKNDITVETSFLESRYLLGEEKLYAKLTRKLDLRRDIVNFIVGKISEQQTRHDKYKGAAKQLEPDIKNTPGGLRDIHTVFWLMQAENLDVTPEKLTDTGVLTADEINLLVGSHQDLARIRIHLHHLAGKNENILFFNYHLELARAMNLEQKDPDEAVEKLMQLFYRSTKIITQLQGILIPMLQRRVYVPYPRIVAKISKNYYQVNHSIAAHDLTVFSQKPREILGVIKHLQINRNISGIAPRTLRAWWQAVQNLDERFARDPANQDLFLGFFKYGRGIFELLQILNIYGFLEKYLPEFGKIVGLLQNDLFHIYPVDDHILMVIYYLTRLENENFSYEAPTAYRLMHAYPKKYILYLAALFHDIGKGRHGHHEVVGARLARHFCLEHRLSARDSELVTWLVRQHLLLSLTAQKKDIGDKKVIQDFCAEVDSPEKLISLYLLTIADMRGTNPAIWNHWRQNLIFNLFSVSLAYLQGSNVLSPNSLLEKQALLNRLINEFPGRANTITQFANDMDETFFANQNEEDIYWQIASLCRAPEINFYNLEFLDEKTFKCIVYLPTKGDELYQLCRIFAHLDLNIIQSRAYLNKNTRVLYKFVVAVPEQYNERDFTWRMKELKEKLDQLIHHRLNVKKLTIPGSVLTRRSRHANIITKMSITQETFAGNEQGYFLVSLVTINRNGLLANIVALFNQYDIHIIFANINTLGERVEDSFLVRAPFFATEKNKTQFKNALAELCSL